MFGESESESPRGPSPWDYVLESSSATEKVLYSPGASMPHLAAEVEEGNIEYKLHLIQPSPARFVRLVTQLKWRLLEGGGQAFYELGVADSGALIGLSPPDLSATLETLYAMAENLGARVMVTKRIEVVGMGVREEDKREFAKKRRDRDREKDYAVSKARAKAARRDAPKSLSPSEASPLSTSSSVSPALAEGQDEDGADIPALDMSLSTSPSPLTRAISTPLDGELDEGLALFTMDDELATFTREDFTGVKLPTAEGNSLISALEDAPKQALPPVTATLSIPPGSLPISLPLPPTKAARRRITRDQRRAERQRALIDGNAPAVTTEAMSKVASAETHGANKPAHTSSEDLSGPVERLADDLAALTVPVSRMIVEAMIVRELEHEEAFLNFAQV